RGDRPAPRAPVARADDGKVAGGGVQKPPDRQPRPPHRPEATGGEMSLSLPFAQVWCIDTEFFAPPGHRPRPICLVGRELRSGKLPREWLWDGPQGPPPYPTDSDTLLVAYYSSAEWNCHLALGWPLPCRILDLYSEFWRLTSGLAVPSGRGLLGALIYHG